MHTHLLKYAKVLTALSLTFSVVNSYGQRGSVKIEVQETATHKPIPNILLSLRNQTFTTDANGSITLQPAIGDTVFITGNGFAKNFVVYNDPNQSRLILFTEPTNKELDEVVVTALGISKTRKSLGYSVQEVKNDKLSVAKSNNLVNDLSGKVAGVRITNSQGNMGSSRIVIRGETSLAGYNQPLFVIDGIPVDNSQLGAGGSRDFANAVSDINPEDIESLSVLKGPTAAALYGSRAAHGVILIKTKSGAKKKGLGITVNSNNTFDNVLILPKFQNVFGQGASGKFSYVDGAGSGVNDNVDESWGPKMQGQLIPQFGSNGVAVPFVAHPNNVKDFFKTGFTTDDGIAIADAGDKYNYRLSFNNSHQTGITPNTILNKRNFSANVSFKLAPKLTVFTTANYYILNAPNLPGIAGKRATSTMLQFIWFGRQVDMDALKKSYFETGSPNNWNNSYYPNPYFAAYENTVQQNRNRLVGDAGFQYEITNDLSVKFHSGVDDYNDRRKLRIAYGTSGTPYGSYTEDAYHVNENNTELLLTYKKDLNQDFNLNIVAGGNIRNNTLEQNYQQAPRLAVPDVYTLANSRDPLVSTSFLSRKRVYSAYGSAQLSYRSYAFINATARNDWSSTLPVGNQSYFYPSINASLVWTDAFNLRSDVLSYGKVRIGWAKVGSDADPYQLTNAYNFATPLDGAPILTSSGIKNNPNLKPETTKSWEAGLEFGFFKNRVHLDVSAYNTNSLDQIVSLDVPAGTGYLKEVFNAGKINNKGIEVVLGITPIRHNDFSWNIDFNFAANKSKVDYLDKEGRYTTYLLGSDGTAQTIAMVGQKYGTIVGTAYQRDNSGNIVVDASGLPVTDPTIKAFGSFQPKWIGGINNNFTYKNFNFGFLVDASIGGKLYSGTNATGNYTGVLEQTLQGRDADHGGLSYFYPGNDNSKAAQPVSAEAGNNTVYDDGIVVKGVTANGQANSQIITASQYYKALDNINEAYIYNASYIKLREARFGYTFSPSWLKKFNIQSATFSITGRNLWIIHKNVPNIDPETAFNTGNGQGLEDLTYPTTRSFGFNLNLKF
ncbi:MULTISPECIES: SusC/RagA family TonB-linked outer membrane protein [Chitinophagaceae]